MATGINNIEKFLRDLFQNFRVKPSNDSWDKISEALDTTNPKDALIPEIDELSTLFKGYKVTPSERVWENIYRILERDKFTFRRLSKSAVTAIVAFFGNTTARVITSIVVVGGVSLIVLNPFKEQPSKLAAHKSTTQVQVGSEKSTPANIPQPHSAINNPQSENNQAVFYPKALKSDITPKTDIPATPTPAIKQTGIYTTIEEPKPLISPDLTVSNTNETKPLPTVSKTEAMINENQMPTYPSLKMGINQNKPKLDKGTALNKEVQQKMDGLIDRFYREWAKKFKRGRELFNIEAYYLPVYGSTTFIAGQENAADFSRSYNEYLAGGPSNCLGINFGYNHKKFVYETGIMYEDMHSLRNDDLSWITYDTIVTIKKDPIGTVYNTKDSTYYTLYITTNDTNINKNVLTKNYRSRMTYHTIELPFLIGYKLIDKRNTLIVRSGIMANIIVKSSEETTYTDETARPYIVYPERNKIGFSALLNFSYDINLNDNFRISVTPTFRYNITGIYKGFTITSNPFTVGLGLGMKYSF